MSFATLDHVAIEGHVSTGFEAVREAFAENFARRHELGGACTAHHRGEKVVDLGGGVRNEEIPNSRLATLAPPGRLEMLFGFRPLRLMVEGMNRHSNISRALTMNPGTSVYLDEQRMYARNLEVPAGGGVATARGIAHAYSVFATSGQELGLRKETVDLLAAPAVPPARGFYDECLKGEVQFSLGFMKPCENWHFGGARSFGSPGTGGALGFADPDAEIAYAYVTSQMGTTFTGDPRDVALRDALYSLLRNS
jgi:CubicO group peptidase (beta-lactamase class C family)